MEAGEDNDDDGDDIDGDTGSAAMDVDGEGPKARKPLEPITNDDSLRGHVWCFSLSLTLLFSPVNSIK
jgi:hypothetical protein